MELQSWLWLSHGLGFGASNSGRVLAEHAHSLPALAASPAALAQSGLFTPRQRQRLLEAGPASFAPLEETLKQAGIQALVYTSPAYPALLKAIHNPPPVLYAKGDASLLNSRLCIAVVGARKPSAYGVQAVQSLGGQIAAGGAVVVSGLAAGLDTEAHKAALAAGQPTVACIAFGHDVCYPSENRGLMQIIQRHGAVVSEYPPGTRPEKPFFLQRNRIIAGLSHGVLVAEARSRSGTMSTVNFAAEWGRDVFAVPGSIFSPLSEGTHALVREGAGLAACAEDVLNAYRGGPYAALLFSEEPALAPAKAQQAPLPAPPAPVQAEALRAVSEAARLAFAQLGAAPVSFAQVCGASGLGPAAAMAALTELELAGLSRQLAGRQFVIYQ